MPRMRRHCLPRIRSTFPSQAAVLHAQLYKPDGDGPFPVVIALHGCGGLAGHSEPVLPRYRDWAEQLLKDGNAVLLPDSYGSRELGPQCRVKERRCRPSRTGGGHPGIAAMADAAALGRARPHQPVGMGQRRQRAVVGGASATVARHVEPDFRSAIAFYPDCRISSGLGWSARVPTLLLIGAKDDVSSPPACRQMVDGARGRSALARIVVYPDAYHDFDRANFPLHARFPARPMPPCPNAAIVGTDAEARADSQKRVAEWLAR
jgi:dienelactone hydrolase